MKPKLGNSETEKLEAEARDNAQIGADLIWAGNWKAAQEHLALAMKQLREAEAEAKVIEI